MHRWWVLLLCPWRSGRWWRWLPWRWVWWVAWVVCRCRRSVRSSWYVWVLDSCCFLFPVDFDWWNRVLPVVFLIRHWCCFLFIFVLLAFWAYFWQHLPIIFVRYQFFVHILVYSYWYFYFSPQIFIGSFFPRIERITTISLIFKIKHRNICIIILAVGLSWGRFITHGLGLMFRDRSRGWLCCLCSCGLSWQWLWICLGRSVCWQP